MSREKSEKNVRNIPVTVRLNEEESQKIIAVCCRLRSVRSGIYAAVMQRQRPTARAVGGALAVAKYAL